MFIFVFAISTEKLHANKLTNSLNACKSSVKSSTTRYWGQIKDLRQNVRIFLDYNRTYNASKFLVLNYLGFSVSGWPLWSVPEAHFIYKSKLSQEQKKQVDDLLNRSSYSNKTDEVQATYENIYSWRRARRAYFLVLSLVTSGIAVDRFLDYVPLSYLVQGKEGLVELKLDRIGEDYQKNYQENITPDYREFLKEIEKDKEVWKLLLEIYKDKKGEDENEKV